MCLWLCFSVYDYDYLISFLHFSSQIMADTDSENEFSFRFSILFIWAITKASSEMHQKVWMKHAICQKVNSNNINKKYTTIY